MDAEVGVRNLADSFRYNVLPDIVRALKLSPEPETPLEDLPEYMHMVALVSLVMIQNKMCSSNQKLVPSTSRAQFCRLLFVPTRTRYDGRYLHECY